MSSSSLPSLSSLQPVPRPSGFVTARSILTDLESQASHSTEASEAIAVPEKPKRGRPKKGVQADDAPTKPQARKKTSTNDSHDVGDVDKAPAKSGTRKRQVATAEEQEGAIDAPPAPKRGRPKKAVAIEDAATANPDTLEPIKPVAKRGRKKTTESADIPDTAAVKPKLLPKPRKTKAAPAPKSIANDSTTALEAPALDVAEVVNSDVQPVARVEAPIEVLDLDLDLAPRRRRDWTPPTESALPPSFQQSSEPATVHGLVAENDAIEAPAALGFTRLMGDFGYQEDNPKPPPSLSRNSSDGPSTKRKRLDPVDVAAVEGPKKRNKKVVEPKEPKPKPPKKPKAPKKKPLTITALATAAYLPQPAVADADQTKLISDFFPQPQSETTAPTAVETAVAKPIRATKGQAAEDKPAPKRKRVAKKVQITVPEVHIKLDSPEAARENAKRQQWLFGSSSQLAAAESPTELRDIQLALKESEDMISSQHMDISHATSHAHVPSAPHGTSLSIGQSDRVLWMSAARDFEDSTFASDESRDNDGRGAFSDEPQQPGYPPTSTKSAPESRPTEIRPQIEVLTISSSASNELESPDSGYVDIDQINRASLRTAHVSTTSDVSSASLATSKATAVVPAPQSVITLETAPVTEVVPRRALGTRDPNINITKQAVDPEGKEAVVAPSKITAKPHVVCLDSPVGRPRKVTSSAAPPRSPVVIRRIVDPSPPTREEARQRYLAASPSPVSLQPSQDRSRDVLPSPILVSPFKSRGRPPKFGPAPKLASPARPRDRPRKSVSPDGLPVPSQLQKSPSAASPSSQRAAIAEPSSDYLDIDAISDVELASHAPSPPRRLPTSPPKGTLSFDRPPLPPLPTLSTFSTTRCSAKQLQTDWPTITPLLFPKITQTIRSMPPSTNHKTPTWHEKILLYDPIVLEDLTLWLNTQGVRVETSIPVKAPKAKKRTNDVDGEEEEVMEKVKEELQPWMVQKWCEEFSVCCLWKEGLRGGVRQKY